MPGDYIVIKDGSFVIQKWVGTITHAEMMECDQRKVRDTSIMPGAVHLVDARHAVFPETDEQAALELIELVTDPNSPTISKIAAVMSLTTKEDWAKAKKFEVLFAKKGISAIVFANFEVACTWCELNANEVQTILDSMAVG